MQRREMLYGSGIGVALVAAVGLLCAASIINHTSVQLYLVWNLFLAIVPLALAYVLVRRLAYHRWSSWEMLGLTAAWLIFLPNSFYLISDFIHLPELAADQLLLGVVTTTMFVLVGMWLGMTSVYLVHTQLRSRLPGRKAAVLIAAALFIASVAIYVGRDLRWNSWDILVNPFGLLFDLSERLLHPAQYASVLLVVGPFFVLLSAIYFAIWQTVRAIRATT